MNIASLLGNTLKAKFKSKEVDLQELQNAVNNNNNNTQGNLDTLFPELNNKIKTTMDVFIKTLEEKTNDTKNNNTQNNDLLQKMADKKSSAKNNIINKFFK